MASNTVFKKYIKAEGTGVNNLKVELYYSLGGMNYFTYKTEKRGYYLSVTPVEINNRDGWTSECYTMFSGIKQLVKEVGRKSAKAAEEATRLAIPWEDKLIEYVCNKENIVLEQ